MGRTEGLFAALNDCLYRNMNTFKYLMLIDFDEFIIPHQASLPKKSRIKPVSFPYRGTGIHNKNTAARRYKIQFGGTVLLKELELFSFTKLNIFVGAI